VDELWSQITRGESQLRWFARRQSGGIAGGILHSPHGLKRLVHNLAPSWDLYYNINLSTGLGLRVPSESITHWCTVLLDIDPTSEDASPMDAALEYLRRARQIVGMVPATIVDSGRGAQVHLHLEPLRLVDGTQRNCVRRAVGQFLRIVRSDAAPFEEGGSSCNRGMNLSAAKPPPSLFGCQLDLSCSDLARVARMPQTINHKTGRWTKLLDEQREEKTTHRLPGIETNAAERILALADVAPQHKDFASRHAVGVVKYQVIWSRLTATAQRFLDGGVAIGERHRSCVAAVKSLQENGVPHSEAQRAVVGGSELCDPPLELSEVLRIVRSTYAT
jgi:hypothetical protein